MSTPEIYTYYEAVERLRELSRVYTGGPTKNLYMAIQAARRRFLNEHSWSFLTANGRITIQAAVTDSTVAYDHTGGATCERQLTLASGSWPSDIQDWAIQVDDIICEVEQRHSSTVLQLDAVMCPPEDIDAGTSYTAFQRWYALPNDFQSMVLPMEESACLTGTYVTPARMEELQRWAFTTGDVYYWTVRSAPGLLGSFGIFLHGATTTTETYDFVYNRRLLRLRYHGEATNDSTGTITVTAGSTTVQGSDTSFDTVNHPGSIMLIGTDSNTPTGWEGSYPYGEMRTIRSVTDTDTLTLDGEIVTARSDVGYRITDPIDLPGDVCEAFLKCCEAEYGHLARLEERKELEAAYRAELQRAKAADCRVQQVRVVGGPQMIYSRLAYNKGRDTD